MPRRPLIAGNWKMHLTLAEARHLAAAVAKSAADLTDREVLIAPPFTALAATAQVLAGSRVLLAGQNVAWAEKGAFTGEISPAMLKDCGCRMAIVGHSERRQIFGESNAMVNRRLRGAIDAALTPILCLGETLQEREGEETWTVLATQLREGLAGVSAAEATQLVLAYEPVWAIGTGKTASSDQAQEAHAFLRGELARLYEKNIASQIRILYGGSVTQENVDSLLRQTDVDGALVGGAALKAESFDRIVHFR